MILQSGAVSALPPWVIQGGAFGLLALVMWWMFKSYLPQLHEQHKVTIEMLMQAFKEEGVANRDVIQGLCQAVSMNAETLKSHNEIMRKRLDANACGCEEPEED